MDHDVLLELHSGEPFDAEYCIQEQEETEETSNVGQLRDSANEGVEQDSQTFVFLDDLKDSTDSEDSEHVGEGTDLQALDLVRNEAEPGRTHNDEIKVVPTIFEVITVKGDEFDRCLNSVDDVERHVEVSEEILEVWWFSMPSTG